MAIGKGFEELSVYQEARKLRARVFRLTRQLPADERYELASQMRRAALSVTNNIAEGHGSRSYRLSISYLYRARGSVNELKDDFTACEDEGYFKKEHLDDIDQQADVVSKLINGYIAYLNERVAADRQARAAERQNRSARRATTDRNPTGPVNQRTSQPVNRSTSQPVPPTAPAP